MALYQEAQRCSRHNPNTRAQVAAAGATGKDGTASGRCMYLSHTQHGVQVVEGPGLVGRGGDEVLVGWVQRHTHHLCRVVCQHSLQSAAATSNT